MNAMRVDAPCCRRPDRAPCQPPNTACSERRVDRRHMRQRAVAEGGRCGLPFFRARRCPLGSWTSPKAQQLWPAASLRISLWRSLEMAALHALWRGITM